MHKKNSTRLQKINRNKKALAIIGFTYKTIVR